MSAVLSRPLHVKMGSANSPTALLPTMAIFLCLGGAGILVLDLGSVNVGFGRVSLELQLGSSLGAGRRWLVEAARRCCIADPTEARDDAGR
jgi:hypothetical protein